MPPKDSSWGLAGLGKSEGVDLSVLDPCDDERSWRLEMYIGSLGMDVELEGPETISSIKEFIAETLNNPKYQDKQIGPGRFQPAGAELLMGHFEKHAVLLIKDGKFGDRYFIYCGDQEGGAWLRFTLIGGEFLEPFVEAIDLLSTNLEDPIED